VVRVGDPNQAINSTFTPSDPIYFRQFCLECELSGRLATMNQAGRSAEIIIAAANFTLEWVVAITAVARMSGVGKTELALQYAMYHWEQGTYPGGVCWLGVLGVDLGTQILPFAVQEFGWCHTQAKSLGDFQLKKYRIPRGAEGVTVVLSP